MEGGIARKNGVAQLWSEHRAMKNHGGFSTLKEKPARA
jgi:hypothetical protein